jgi:hypothetical protein
MTKLWAPARNYLRAPKHLPLAAALRLLRKPDHLLVLLHTKGGNEFAVMPGGPVTEKVARRILEHPDCQPVDRGLLADCPQSWKLEAP